MTSLPRTLDPDLLQFLIEESNLLNHLKPVVSLKEQKDTIGKIIAKADTISGCLEKGFDGSDETKQRNVLDGIRVSELFGLDGSSVSSPAELFRTLVAELTVTSTPVPPSPGRRRSLRGSSRGTTSEAQTQDPATIPTESPLDCPDACAV